MTTYIINVEPSRERRHGAYRYTVHRQGDPANFTEGYAHTPQTAKEQAEEAARQRHGEAEPNPYLGEHRIELEDHAPKTSAAAQEDPPDESS